MSAIYFHSEHGTAELRGSERAHMGILCGEIFCLSLGSLHDYPGSPSWTRKMIPPGHYLHTAPNYEVSFRSFARGGTGSDDSLQVNGEEFNLLELTLNTALATQSDTIRLLARLHGQCEIHCYVESGNRDWLAGIIEQGRKSGIMRSRQGWEGVVEFLRSQDDGPVVCSYSVCDQFPNPDIASWEPPGGGEGEEEDEDYDAWYDLPKEEQWRLSISRLRSLRGMELTPDGWDDFYFGPEPLNGFQLYETVNSSELLGL